MRIIGIDVPGFGVPTHAEAKDVLAGAMLKYARTEAERKAARDPRPSLATRYPTRDAYVAKVKAAAAAQVRAGFLLPEDVERAVAENVGLYDRVLAHDPTDQSCEYLFAKP